MRDWLVRIIGVAVVALVLDLLIARRARSTPREGDGGDIVVRQPRASSILHGVFSGMIGAGAIAILVTPFEGVPFYGRLIGGLWFLAPAILGVWWSGMMLTRRFVLRSDGIEMQTKKASTLIRWDDVTEIDTSDYGPIWKWMMVRAGSCTIRVPMNVPGSAEVLAAARAALSARRSQASVSATRDVAQSATSAPHPRLPDGEHVSSPLTRQPGPTPATIDAETDDERRRQ